MKDPVEELFDVVDESDRVMRQAPRRVVHAEGWLHRAVHVLVFNQAGQLFLQKRSMSKDMSPGLWDSSCSGHLDAGEGYDHAAVRELQEEIGLKLEHAPTRLFRIEACKETGQEFVWVYRVFAEGPFVLCPEEIDRGEWIWPQELSQRIASRPHEYCSSFRHIWARITKDDIL